jgi:hypothetical protein
MRQMHHQLERASVAKSNGRDVMHVARCQMTKCHSGLMCSGAAEFGSSAAVDVCEAPGDSAGHRYDSVVR